MNEMICIGRLCRSKKGRDSGRLFIIKEIEDENYVLVTDGVMRKVDTPKRKKLKHLELKPCVVENVAAKLKAGTKVFDAEVRSAIAQAAPQE